MDEVEATRWRPPVPAGRGLVSPTTPRLSVLLWVLPSRPPTGTHTGITYRDHIQGSHTGITYTDHIQGSHIGITYRDHIQGSHTGITHRHTTSVAK